jgi:hypothetical protein
MSEMCFPRHIQRPAPKFNDSKLSISRSLPSEDSSHLSGLNASGFGNTSSLRPVTQGLIPTTDGGALRWSVPLHQEPNRRVESHGFFHNSGEVLQGGCHFLVADRPAQSALSVSVVDLFDGLRHSYRTAAEEVDYGRESYGRCVGPSEDVSREVDYDVAGAHLVQVRGLDVCPSREHVASLLIGVDQFSISFIEARELIALSVKTST